MTFGLTPKQDELLTFLRERQAAGSVMPSFNEMAHHVGLQSKSGVHRMLDARERRGVIKRLHGQARAIEVVGVSQSPMIDAGTELALQHYCLTTGIARYVVMTDALREYFRAHPIPEAAGAER